MPNCLEKSGLDKQGQVRCKCFCCDKSLMAVNFYRVDWTAAPMLSV